MSIDLILRTEKVAKDLDDLRSTKNLMSSVFMLALVDLVKDPKPDSYGNLNYQTAVSWFKTRNINYFLSFESACSVLGINSEAVRKYIAIDAEKITEEIMNKRYNLYKRIRKSNSKKYEAYEDF